MHSPNMLPCLLSGIGSKGVEFRLAYWDLAAYRNVLACEYRVMSKRKTVEIISTNRAQKFSNFSSLSLPMIDDIHIHNTHPKGYPALTALTPPFPSCPKKHNGIQVIKCEVITGVHLSLL